MHACWEWGIKSESSRECKCQWVVFPLCPWPGAPFDLSSRASQYSATFTPSLFKAKPCSPVGTAQTNPWLTLCHLWCHITGHVHRCHRITLNHFSLYADCRISARKCTVALSSHCTTHMHARTLSKLIPLDSYKFPLSSVTVFWKSLKSLRAAWWHLVKRLAVLSLHGFNPAAVVSSSICKACDSNWFEAFNCSDTYEKTLLILCYIFNEPLLVYYSIVGKGNEWNNGRVKGWMTERTNELS